MSDRSECTGGPVCVAHGSAIASVLAVSDAFKGIVAFDPPAGLVSQPSRVPVIWQLGTRNMPGANALANMLRDDIYLRDGSRVYDWRDAAPGLSLPGLPAFNRRVDSLAHSRTLELLRRIVRPHYDLVALFAEHIRHEFETRDVDATMETMIADPYVNLVAMLAGGVGNDILKRF